VSRSRPLFSLVPPACWSWAMRWCEVSAWRASSSSAVRMRSLVDQIPAARRVYLGAPAVISRRRSFLRVREGCWWAESSVRVSMHQNRTASLRAVATIASGIPPRSPPISGSCPASTPSGEQVKRGPITKAGSPHARRLRVEAAHHYRHKPAIYKELARRQRGQDPLACEIGWRCQQRLHRQWRRLRLERGKPGNVVVIALARELANFVWEVGQLK
jgi:hypothetical protein